MLKLRIGLILCPSAEKRLKDLGLEMLLWFAYAEVPFGKDKQSKDLIRKLPVCIIGKWVRVNDQNPIIEILKEMKEREVDESIRSKYDRTIEFLDNNKKLPVLKFN